METEKQEQRRERLVVAVESIARSLEQVEQRVALVSTMAEGLVDAGKELLETAAVLLRGPGDRGQTGKWITSALMSVLGGEDLGALLEAFLSPGVGLGHVKAQDAAGAEKAASATTAATADPTSHADNHVNRVIAGVHLGPNVEGHTWEQAGSPWFIRCCACKMQGYMRDAEAAHAWAQGHLHLDHRAGGPAEVD